MNSMNPEFHDCECGHRWRHGQSGAHDCGPYYRQTIRHFRDAAAAPQVVADERKPFAFVIVDKDRNPEFVTPDWNSAQEHINDACEMGIENAGKWKAIPAFEMRPTDDKLWDETMRDRDQYHEWADKLSEAIALHFGGDIGEHSNMNCPWAEALEIIDQAAPVQPVAVPDCWKLVPVKPTEEMMHAAQDVPAPRPYGAVYRAMIDAAIAAKAAS